MLCAGTPYDRAGTKLEQSFWEKRCRVDLLLQLLGDLLVDGVAKVFDGALALAEDNRR
jgi:hypothetical protein